MFPDDVRAVTQTAQRIGRRATLSAMFVFDPPRVAVFCGSRSGSRPVYEEAARALGRRLVHNGLGLVYGGGSVGLMGAIADAVLEAGGEAIGVIPKALATAELAHASLTQLHVVEGMHPRKKMMADLASCFVAMPGGIGTLEELFEAYTWTQLGIQDKPVGLLNAGGYWDALEVALNASVEEGFLSAEHRALLVSDDQPQRLLEKLAAARRRGGTPPAGLEV